MKSAHFWSIKAQNAANTAVLASILTKSERKSAFSKQVRIILVTLSVFMVRCTEKDIKVETNQQIGINETNFIMILSN